MGCSPCFLQPLLLLVAFLQTTHSAACFSTSQQILRLRLVLRLAETFGSGGRYCGMSQIRLTRAHSFRRLESDFYLAVSTPASAPRQVKVSFI